jgi:hypothetical protein
VTSVSLHISFIKPVAASALSITVHFVETCSHVLPVDVMATISLIDRFDFPARNTLKSQCIPNHITKPDVLTEYPVKLLFMVRLRHIPL